MKQSQEALQHSKFFKKTSRRATKRRGGGHSRRQSFHYAPDGKWVVGGPALKASAAYPVGFAQSCLDIYSEACNSVTPDASVDDAPTAEKYADVFLQANLHSNPEIRALLALHRGELMIRQSHLPLLKQKRHRWSNFAS